MQLQDHFLIAMPNLNDDYFEQSVVYICEHNDKGAMGISLCQPTDLSIAELVSKVNFMMKTDRTFGDDYVLAGGPVNIERGFILHTKTAVEFQHSYKVSDRLWLTTSVDVIETFGTVDAPEKYLVSLGCASWAENQLEQEIANNDWLVVPANEHILFDEPCNTRWEAANRLLGIQSYNFASKAGRA